MDSKQPNNPQLARERVVYDYLAALEDGDIDGIIASLQQAVHDAPLDQMIADAHQSYFQDEQTQQNEIADADTRTDLPALTPPPRRNQKRIQSRRLPWWMRTLAAVLLVGVLIGSFVALLAWRHAGTNTTNVGQPAIVACKPTSWQLINTGMSGSLSGVAALSPVDAWAVGGTDWGSGLPLIEHWDGQKWNLIHAPRLPVSNGDLQAIAAIASDNIWAVGEQFNAISRTREGSTLIEHWNGQQWAIVASPNARQGKGITNVLSSIAVISENDIWATGVWQDANRNMQGTLVEHWNGQSWNIVQDQGSQTRASVLLSITALSGGQVMASGGQLGSDHMYHALLERWDGRNWQRVDITPLGQHANVITSLSATSASNIWAVVRQSIPISGQLVSTANYLAHWNGLQWSKVSVPNWLIGAGHNDSISRVLVMNNKSVWIISNQNTTGNLRPLIAHWDGKSWSQLNLPDKSLTFDSLASDLAVSASAIWVVGRIIGNEASPSFHTLLEQQIRCL